jgi:hypothetical protein
MMIKVATSPAATFGWSDGCRVTGNPVGTDPAPNVTQPSANRILTLDFRAARLIYRFSSQGLAFFPCFVEGGTSVAIDKWFFDSALGVWVKYGVTVTTAFASTSIIGPGEQLMIIPGIKWFFQITTVTGAVTAFNYAFI